MPIELEMPVELMESAVESALNEQASADAASEAAELVESGADASEVESESETIEPSSETTEGDGKAIEPDAEPADESPTPEQQAQAEFRQQIRNISDELAEAALDRLKAEAVYKQAKAREKLAVEALASAMERGPEVLPLFDRRKKSQSQASATTEPEPITGPIVLQPLAPEPSEQWRAASISELQLKPKLAERLHDSDISTIGQLEDLRAEISQGRSKWPKGIGPAKITEIEDAVIAWLSRNRDAEVLAEASQAQAEADQPECPQQEPESENCESENREGAIIQRAREINTGETNCLHPVSCKIDDPNSPYASGFDAYHKGWPLTDCPYMPGVEQDDWIRGWYAANAVDRWADSDSESSNGQPELASLDDL